MTISPFRVLNRVSVWVVNVDEEQSIHVVTFLVPGQFHHHGRYIQTQFYTFKLLLIIYENDFLQLIFNICVYKH